MRIAIIPNPTFRNLEGESEFLMLRNFARDVLSVRKDVYFYFVVPSWCEQPAPEEGIYYLVDEADSNLSFYERIATVPGRFFEWFNARIGRFPIDAVLTTRTAAAFMMNRYLRDFRDKHALISVVIDESIAIDSTLGDYFVGHEDLIARSMGYFSAAHSFFDTDWEMERAITAAKRYLAPHIVKELQPKLSVVPCGVSVDRVKRIVEKATRPKMFQIMCGNRLNRSKRPENLLALYNQFFAFGRQVRIVLTTPSGGKFLEGRTDIGHLKIYKELDSDKFVKLAASSHAIVETTRFGGFSVGLSEMILAGPVLILPRLKWIKSLVGELWDTYPYFYKDFDQAAMMLRNVYENYEEASKHMEVLRKFWEKEYDSKVQNLRMFAKIEELAENPGKSSQWSGRNRELVQKTMEELTVKEGLPSVGIDIVYSHLVALSDSMRDMDVKNPRRGKMSRWALYRLLRNEGWRDLCNDSKPVFGKAEKD